MNSNRSHIVEIKQGKVKGRPEKNVTGGEFLIFNAIPYAQPPIGELRFKDPLPPKSIHGICNIEGRVIKSAQYDDVMDCFSGTEDCLYLNVATNSLVGKRPVMVWVHGGGFISGTASTKLFGPDYLMKQDIVFVSIGYRLGCLGSLNLDLPDASGNQAMKDLVAGLKWVQENIAAFGGDPENVTIFGQSSGGAAVHYITLSPLAEGLFHKAIVQSGVSTNAWAFLENPVELGLRFTSVLAGRPINDTTEALEILMKASPEQCIQTQRKMNPKVLDIKMASDFVPSVDNKSLNPFMPEHPKERFKRGINVPLIIGCTADEGLAAAISPYIEASYHEINTDFAAVFARWTGCGDTDRIAKIINPVKEFYLGETGIMSAKTADVHVRLIGDLNFYNGIQQVIEIQSNLSTPTYVYQFSYIASYPTVRTAFENYLKEIKGAGHSDDIGALFHSPCYMGNRGLQKGTMDYLIMERLTRMWTNFAKTGNPTVNLDEALTTKWEPIAKDNMVYLDINKELVAKVNLKETAWKFWKPILETL